MCIYRTPSLYKVNIKESRNGLPMINKSYKNEEDENKPLFRLLTSEGNVSNIEGEC